MTLAPRTWFTPGVQISWATVAITFGLSAAFTIGFVALGLRGRMDFVEPRRT